MCLDPWLYFIIIIPKLYMPDLMLDCILIIITSKLYMSALMETTHWIMYSGAMYPL
jgi:hypothetical protein